MNLFQIITVILLICSGATILTIGIVVDGRRARGLENWYSAHGYVKVFSPEHGYMMIKNDDVKLILKDTN